MDAGATVKEAIKEVVEKKIMGTWKLAVMPLESPEHLYFVKNSGEFLVGQLEGSVVVSTEEALFQGVKCSKVEKVPNNYLVDLKADLSLSMERLEKKIKVERRPSEGFAHIFEEEIFEAVKAVNNCIDYGQKFVSAHQVYLGGFEHAHEELRLVQNLIIAANGSSKIAADYGAYVMRELKVFNTVRVFDGFELKRGDLERLRFGGYLTLSQSGESLVLVNALKMAKELELSCMNVVNVEDSPITKSGDGRDVGFYMKSGYCYCDIKSFIPQVVSMALVALWFSDHKAKKPNSKSSLRLTRRGDQADALKDSGGPRAPQHEAEVFVHGGAHPAVQGRR